jgi:hypothetical protein
MLIPASSLLLTTCIYIYVSFVKDKLSAARKIVIMSTMIFCSRFDPAPHRDNRIKIIESDISNNLKFHTKVLALFMDS